MSKSHSVDATDLAIIQKLEEDGRQPYADIAAELGLAASTVQQRVHRLIKTGVMRLTAVVDPVAVGKPVIATIAIKVDGKRLRQAAADIATLSEVDYVVICTGPYDILIEVSCSSNDCLLSFLSNKLAKVTGVRETDTFLYLSVVKNNY